MNKQNSSRQLKRSQNGSLTGSTKKLQKYNQEQNNQVDNAKKSFKKIFTLIGSLVPQKEVNSPQKQSDNNPVCKSTFSQYSNNNQMSKQISLKLLEEKNQTNINQRNQQPKKNQKQQQPEQKNEIQSPIQNVLQKAFICTKQQNQPNTVSGSLINLNGETKNESQTQAQSTQSKTDNFLKKLFTMTGISGLQSTATNTQQHSGYFKDNAIKVASILQRKQSSVEPVMQNQDYYITSQWLGQVFDKCVSSSFMHFISRNLDYKQSKTYCCEQILSNIIQAIKDGKSLRAIQKMPSIGALDLDRPKKPQAIRKKIIYQNQPMKYINQQGNRILTHLCNKYPQSDTIGVNKQVAQLVSHLKIDNWMDDQYDLVRKSQIQFKYKMSGDYSKQIMQFLNFLIELPFKQHKKYSQLTNYKYFQLTMNKIFQIVYYKDSKKDLNSIVNDSGEIDLFLKQKQNLTQQQVQYKEKVKAYTTTQIGTKISSTTKTFSQEDIQSGIIKVQNNAVARVIDKWAQQLGTKFLQAEKNILNRIHRFKSADDQRFFKIGNQSQQSLYKILGQKKKKLQKFTDELRESIYDLSKKLAINESSDVSQLYFLQEREKRIGQFAVKMAQASSQYFIQIIQKQINYLLQAIIDMKSAWVQKYKYKESPLFQMLNISLITFKIGDLMRCKLISNEDQIVRVLNIFVSLSEMWDNKFIKIIRVKNRLQTGTRDILINFMFDQICPCELQLAVAEKITQKQQYFDKFNHFLYELKRAYLGPVMEMCKIWNQYQNKSQTYAKEIEKSTRKKRNSKKPLSKQFLQISMGIANQIYEYKFPFLCTQCNSFTPRNCLIFFNSLCLGKIYCGNCIKRKLCMDVQDLAHVKKKFIFKKYIMRYPNIYKLFHLLKEIKSFSQAVTKKFQIHVPVKSQTIHMKFSMITLLNRYQESSDIQQFAFVHTTFLKDGTLHQQMCNQKISKNGKQNQTGITSVQKLQEQLQDYIFYGWDAHTELMPLPENCSVHYLQLIDKFIPFIHKIQQQQGKYAIKIAAVQVQPGRYYFIPFFVLNDIQMAQQLIQKSNIDSIIKSLQQKQEVLQISGRKITGQITSLELSVKLKIAHTIRQIYLDKNQLTNLDFIEHLHFLKILHASKNKIQKIPNIPRGLQQLRLQQNRITVINNINANEEQFENFKLYLLNMGSNQIQKIQNLQNLRYLRVLNLSDNKIKKIQGLPSGLMKLGLPKNKIQKIQNMSHLTQLRNASLALNLITKIQNLEGCKSLQSIALNFNNITKIQNLQGLTNLKTIYLNSTGLDNSFLHETSKDLYEGMRSLKKLKKIFMESNKIKCLLHVMGLITFQGPTKQIKKNLKDPFIELQEVSLADNELVWVQHFQDVMPMASIINLKNNKIKKIDNLLKLTLLTEFNASYNMITDLPLAGWEKLFKIKYLNLSHNKIKFVPDIKFLLFVKQLFLQFNQITTVHSFPMTPYRNPDFSRQINLQNNYLFVYETSQEDFERTIASMKELNEQSIINFTNNGTCPKKLELARQIKQDYELKNILIRQGIPKQQ